MLVRRQREEELKQVFRSYDSDHDGNLDLAEFTRIVTDVDTSAAAGLSSIFVAEQWAAQLSLALFGSLWLSWRLLGSGLWTPITALS